MPPPTSGSSPMSERAAPTPGGPRVPRPRMTWLVLAYGAYGVVLLLAYLVAGFAGYSYESQERDSVPSSVRQAPGGYRSYHLWHSGYQGGK
jgi:hypothetical protein